MKYVFLSLLLLASISLIGFIPDSYAETFRGLDYSLTTNPDSSYTRIIGLSPYINSGDQFVPFVYTDDLDFHIVETNHGSVKLHKSSCTFEFYNNGYISTPEFDQDGNIINWNHKTALFSDNIVPLMANEGTMDYSIINSINNESCVASWDGSELLAKKEKANTGILEYAYILNDGKWKTELRATNLSNLSDKLFGFTQTVNLNKDTIHYGGAQRNLDNFDGQTFNRTWLENNEGKLINLLNGFYFDFDLGFENLYQVNVFDTGINQSKLSFDYVYNQSVILPGETLIIDPTFGGIDNDSWYRVGTTAISGTACSTVWSSSDQALEQIYLGVSGGANNCQYLPYQFDLDLPDGASFTAVDISNIDVDTVVSGRNCDVNAVAGDIDSLSGQDLMDNILGGTNLVSNNSFCATVGTGKTLSLGASAVTDLQTRFDNDEDTWAFGITYYDHTRDGATHYSRFSDVQLTLTYDMPPDPPKQFGGDLNSVLTWSAGELNGDTHTSYEIEYYDTTLADWIEIVSQSGVNYTDETPLNGYDTVKYRAFDTGALGRGCSQSIMNSTITANLQSHFPFCYTMNDNGIDDNDGTTSGNEIYQNVTGSVYFEFDGSNPIVLPNETDYDYENTDPLSIFMCTVLDPVAGNFVFLSKRVGFTSTDNGYTVGTNSGGTVFLALYDSNTSFAVSTTSQVDDGNPHCLGFTYDGSGNTNGINTYFDGLLENTGSSNTITGTMLNNLSVYVGSQSGGNNDLPSGTLLYNVMVFDTELTAHDMENLYLEQIDHNAEPEAPSLVVTALSDSSFRATITNGTDTGAFQIKDYALRCEFNSSGSWVTHTANSTIIVPRAPEYTSLSQGAYICQARDGSSAGWSLWSANATETLSLQVLSDQRTTITNPDDKLLAFINFIAGQGGVYFGLGAVPFGVMLIGFMAGKKTVRIFTLATLMLMGILHASGYYVYPDWYWTLALLFGIILVMGRMKSD